MSDYRVTRINEGGRIRSIRVIEGPPGPAGGPLNILGTLNDASELPGTGDDGDAFVLDDTGHIVYWANNQWNDGGQWTGPKGDKGDRGDKGNDGVGIPDPSGASIDDVIAIGANGPEWVDPRDLPTKPPVVDVFTTSGTWNRPPGDVKMLFIYSMGGGRGGGRGGSWTSSQNIRAYGEGGDPGRAWSHVFMGENLPSSETVTIGAGGTGAVGGAGNFNTYNQGAAGGDCSFGNLTYSTADENYPPASEGRGGDGGWSLASGATGGSQEAKPGAVSGQIVPTGYDLSGTSRGGDGGDGGHTGHPDGYDGDNGVGFGSGGGGGGSAWWGAGNVAGSGGDGAGGILVVVSFY